MAHVATGRADVAEHGHPAGPTEPPSQEAGRHPPPQPLHKVLPLGIDCLGANPVLLRHLRPRPLIGRAEEHATTGGAARGHSASRVRSAVLAARGESRSYEGSTQSIRRTTLTRMAMGTRETDQPPLWIATSDLPTSPGHPFYARLTTLLDGHHVDRFVEGLCDRFYAPVMGRPSLAPGRYFRLLLVGSFEGIDSERGIAWRATDSLAVRSFLRVAVDEAPPDHSTMARTRRLIDLETHRTVFTWVQQRLVEADQEGRAHRRDMPGGCLAFGSTACERPSGGGDPASGHEAGRDPRLRQQGDRLHDLPSDDGIRRGTGRQHPSDLPAAPPATRSRPVS